MNLAVNICFPKMVAGLLSHPKRQFYPSENFIFITKIPGDTLLTKIPAELPSTEKIFKKLAVWWPCIILILALVGKYRKIPKIP